MPTGKSIQLVWWLFSLSHYHHHHHWAMTLYILGCWAPTSVIQISAAWMFPVLRSPCAVLMSTGKPTSLTTFLISEICNDSGECYFFSLVLPLLWILPYVTAALSLLHTTLPHSGHGLDYFSSPKCQYHEAECVLLCR